jgi:hypothetical protein
MLRLESLMYPEIGLISLFHMKEEKYRKIVVHIRQSCIVFIYGPIAKCIFEYTKIELRIVLG